MQYTIYRYTQTRLHFTINTPSRSRGIYTFKTAFIPMNIPEMNNIAGVGLYGEMIMKNTILTHCCASSSFL